MKKLLFLFSVIFFFSALAADVKGEKSLLLKYDNLKTFSSSFVQYFKSRHSGEETEERGVLGYKAPGMMRFDYKNGKEKTRQYYISTEKVILINHEKKSLMTQPGKGDLAKYLVFLKGTEEIRTRFDVAKSDAKKAVKVGIRMDENAAIYKLTPKKDMKSVRYIFLIVKEREVSSVVLIDNLNNINQFVFKDILYDKEIKDTYFKPEIPAGYDKANF